MGTGWIVAVLALMVLVISILQGLIWLLVATIGHVPAAVRFVIFLRPPFSRSHLISQVFVSLDLNGIFLSLSSVKTDVD